MGTTNWKMGFIHCLTFQPLPALARGNSLAFLMDLERMFDVGRSFGTNAQQQPENYCFGAYGQEIPFPEEFRNFHSAYYV